MTNLRILDELAALADEHGITVAQLALAWVLAQGDHILAIPGTRFEDCAKQNLTAAELEVDESALVKAATIMSPLTISGERWSEKLLMEVDSEQYRYSA